MIKLKELTEEELNKLTEDSVGDTEEYKEHSHRGKITKCLNDIKKETANINKTIQGIEEYLDKEDYSLKEWQPFINYELKGFSKVITSLCEKANRLIHLTGYRSEEPKENVSECTDIDISEEDDIITIRIPELLPKRKTFGYSLVYSRYLPAFKTYFENRQRRTDKKKITIEFTFNYSTSRIIDYDNLETKQIIDLITGYCVFDDNPEYCSIIMNYAITGEESTVIKVY